MKSLLPSADALKAYEKAGGGVRSDLSSSKGKFSPDLLSDILRW
jgi:hypothetical protein